MYMKLIVLKAVSLSFVSGEFFLPLTIAADLVLGDYNTRTGTISRTCNDLRVIAKVSRFINFYSPDSEAYFIIYYIHEALSVLFTKGSRLLIIICYPGKR